MIVLLISQLFYVATLVPWFFFTAFSYGLLAGLFKELDTLELISFIAVVVYPIAIIGSMIGSWIFHKKGNYKKANYLNCIPLLWVIVFLIVANV